ncbi:MAG: cation:proton antiporter [Flavobacteriales bacterium]|nr:MAG: cation:proton antiporter [Flavobacteriales bacterium]
MHAPPLFGELVVILALSAGILMLFRRFRLPGILAFILTGMIAGPHGLGWVRDVEEVVALAEIGVVFLLFVIGMEFSLKKLANLGKTVFVGGALQVALTITGIGGVLHAFGMRTESGIFIGFLVCLSSTAIVLRALQERGRTDSAPGRVATAILIFQDIVVVPMMLLTPLLAGQSDDIGNDLLWLLGKMAILLVAVFVSGRYLVPRLLRVALKGRGNELFIITIVVICFAAAYTTQAMGLSLALGAFFAGLVISETEHAYHATGIVQPFHELFLSFFFVSIGMLVDGGLFLRSPLTILALFIGATLVKVLAATIAVWVLRYPLRTALHTALSLFQLGEFGFVLAIPGLKLGLLSSDHYQLFLAVSILGMATTPLMLDRSERIVRRVFMQFVPAAVSERLDRVMRVKLEQVRKHASVLKGHLVVIGYGLNGQNVARAALNAGVRCAVIEEDPDQAALARSAGLPVLHGDACNTHMLEQAHVESARVIVVAISDSEQTVKIVAAIRSITSTAYIIVRTRYVRDMERYLDVGANEVIPEEFETSIEIFYRVLRKYLIPEDRIQGLVAQCRSQHYGMLRGAPSLPRAAQAKQDTLTIPGLEIATLPVTQGRGKVVGRSIGEAGLREKYGVTVLAINRGGRYITNMRGDTRILTDDVLYLLGSPESIVRLDQDLR